MRLVSEVRERVRALRFRRREDRELEEELAFHLEMEAERLVRDQRLDAAEARRRAALRLGGATQVGEATREARGVGWLEDVARDLRLASRRLLREPGFCVAAVVSVALGIGVCTAVFVLVNAVLIRPLPYPDAGRLVEVGHAAPGAELAVTGLSAGTLLHYRRNSQAFDDIGVYLEDVRALTDAAGAPEQVRVALASPDLFQVLGVAPHLGRFPVAADVGAGDRGGVYMSHDLWVRRYGADPGVVGRTIEINRRPEVVVGVAPPGFHFPHPETHLWIGWPPERLLARFGGPRADVRGLFLSGVARLRRGVSPQEAERDLGALVRTLPDVYPDVTAEQIQQMGLRAVVTPLKDGIVGDVRAALLLLLATAGFLLLITWANVTNLALVRAEHQARGVAVERALGASEARVARRLLSESLLLAGAGGALGLALAYVAVELRFGFEPEWIPRLREVAMDRTGLGLALGLSLLSGVLLSASALRSARRARAALVVGAPARATAGRAEQGRRRALVAAQVALACMLLVGSALTARSYWRLSRVDLGFQPAGALTFFLPLPSDPYSSQHAMARAHHDVLGRIRALPGVEAAEAATVSVFPLTPVPDYYNDRVAAADRAVADSAGAPYALVGLATPGYFRAMGIPLLRGRAFQAADAGRGAPAVILGAALARALFGEDDPLGRQVRLAATGDRSYEVVGVVGDVPSRAIGEPPAPALYFSNLPPSGADPAVGGVPSFSPRDEQYVVRTSLPPASLVASIRQVVREVDPKLVLMRPGTLQGLVDDSMARTRLTMLLLLAGAGTALALGAIGIYGVLAYAVRQRTAELGVRIALGAAPQRVVRMVLRQGALLALVGTAGGLLAALALTRFVGSLLYQVSPSDPAAFAAVAALVLAAALTASYLPARRAGRIDPVRALRGE